MHTRPQREVCWCADNRTHVGPSTEFLAAADYVLGGRSQRSTCDDSRQMHRPHREDRRSEQNLTCPDSKADAVGCGSGDGISGSAAVAVLGVAAAGAVTAGASGGTAAAAAAEAAATAAGCAPGSAGLLRMSASKPMTCGSASRQGEQDSRTGGNVGSGSAPKTMYMSYRRARLRHTDVLPLPHAAQPRPTAPWPAANHSNQV